MVVKKSKKEKKKEAEKKKEEDKKKEGGSFKSEKPGKKSKGQRTAPVFDDEPSDSSAAPIQNNAEQNQLTPQTVTDTSEKANTSTKVVPSGNNINTTNKEKKKKEADKKKEGGSFKSDKTVNKSKAKRTSPVFDDEPSNSSAVPIQINAEQNQPTPQTVTDTTGKANTTTEVFPSGDKINTPKEEEKKKTEETQPAEKPSGN
jgi:hypothetical protein